MCLSQSQDEPPPPLPHASLPLLLWTHIQADVFRGDDSGIFSESGSWVPPSEVIGSDSRTFFTLFGYIYICSGKGTMFSK
jgi:hypothetical protein